MRTVGLPKPPSRHIMVGPVRLELTTSRLSVVRSNQLSYEPKIVFCVPAGRISGYRLSAVLVTTHERLLVLRAHAPRHRNLVNPAGLEPATSRLKAACSTIELRVQILLLQRHTQQMCLCSNSDVKQRSYNA